MTFGGAINETIIIVSVFIYYWDERVYKSISHLVGELNNTSRLWSNFWKEENSQQTLDAHQDCPPSATLIQLWSEKQKCMIQLHCKFLMLPTPILSQANKSQYPTRLINTFTLCCKNQSLGQTGLICYVGVGIYICIRLLYWHVQILQIHNIQIQWLMYPAH